MCVSRAEEQGEKFEVMTLPIEPDTMLEVIEGTRAA